MGQIYSVLINLACIKATNLERAQSSCFMLLDFCQL